MSFTEEKGHIDIKLPLQQPVDSINLAPVNVGLPEHLTLKYFYGLIANKNIWQFLAMQKSKEN